jgi:hypothetical protein
MSESRYEERVLLADGVRLELRLRSRTDYRLACVKDGRVLVEYRSGDAYPFQSVEKLRYDFERDAADALRTR